MRYYDIDGNQYISVTTMLSLTSDKTFLTEWKKRIGEEKANQISKEACSRGTHLHSKIEDYLNGKEIETDPLFFNIKPKLKHLVPQLMEEVMYSHTLKIAGRVDCIGLYKDTLSVIDFKTSSKTKRKDWITDYFLQATLYSLCYEEMTGIKISQLVILVTSPDECQEFIVQRKDYWKLLQERYKKYQELIKNELNG